MFLEELFEKKDEKKKKIVFVETDEQQPFPNDTMAALEKTIKKEAKDLERSWKNAIALTEFVFLDLDVPQPKAHLKKRWEQYLGLLKIAIKSLADARGFKSDWTTT